MFVKFVSLFKQRRQGILWLIDPVSRAPREDLSPERGYDKMFSRTIKVTSRPRDFTGNKYLINL
jgi:hypothetical protein